MTDDLVLVAVRVADMPIPSVPSWRTVCGRCEHDVWVSDRGHGWLGPIACVVCVIGDPRDASWRPAPWVRDDLVDHAALERFAARHRPD